MQQLYCNNIKTGERHIDTTHLFIQNSTKNDKGSLHIKFMAVMPEVSENINLIMLKIPIW